METGKIVFGVNKETGKLVLDQMESPLYAEIDALKRENEALKKAMGWYLECKGLYETHKWHYHDYPFPPSPLQNRLNEIYVSLEFAEFEICALIDLP